MVEAVVMSAVKVVVVKAGWRWVWEWQCGSRSTSNGVMHWWHDPGSEVLRWQ